MSVMVYIAVYRPCVHCRVCARKEHVCMCVRLGYTILFVRVVASVSVNSHCLCATNVRVCLDSMDDVCS